jgi:hypothetical protein
MHARPGADAIVPAPMPTALHHNAAGRQCRRQSSQCREPVPGRSSIGPGGPYTHRPIASLPLPCRCAAGPYDTHVPDVCWMCVGCVPDVCRMLAHMQFGQKLILSS